MTKDEEIMLENYRKSKIKKKNGYGKFIVALVIALNSAFSVGALYVFLRTGSEPSTLIACWFAFTTGELWMLSSIKKNKIKKEDDLDE